MRECKIVLPLFDNDGRPLEKTNEALLTRLVDTFGGCTRVLATGSWVGPNEVRQDEDVYVYTFAANAVHNDEAVDKTIKHIATLFGIGARQKAVYWTGHDGEVHIDELV